MAYDTVGSVTPLNRDELLARTGNHPYVAMMTTGRDTIAYTRDGAFVWRTEGPWGPVVASLGDAATVLPLTAGLRAAGLLDDAGYMHAPRATPETIAQHMRATIRDDWDFLWTTAPPPVLPHEERVVRLGDNDSADIDAVLDEALPDSSSRPGQARIHSWYGIRSDDRLVAVAADRTRGIGFLAAIAVVRDHQGQGLGAALTARLTRSLLSGYAAVALGVVSDNVAAQRLYARLGYTGRQAITSIRFS